MSIHNSYFSRNNTIVYSGETNTGRNPIIELSYAEGGVKVPIGFSRCIFDIDLTELQEKYNQKIWGVSTEGAAQAQAIVKRYIDKDLKK